MERFSRATLVTRLMPKICVIGENDPFIARLLHRFAEESGLAPARARVGQELLALVRRVKPVVVILEAELPGKMRGWEAARALKADPETCSIPIIICSWLPEAEARALVGEVSGHLQKPELHCDDFIAALQAAGVEIGPRLAPDESASPPDQI